MRYWKLFQSILGNHEYAWPHPTMIGSCNFMLHGCLTTCKRSLKQIKPVWRYWQLVTLLLCYYLLLQSTFGNSNIPDLAWQKLDDQIIAFVIVLWKFITLNQLFMYILTIIFFRRLWTRPGMPNQTQQRFHDRTNVSMNV